MTKKLIIVFGLLMATMGCFADDETTYELGEEVNLYPELIEEEEPGDYVDPSGALPQRPRAPKRAPNIYKNGYMFFLGSHNGYGIQLIDETLGENGTVVYSDVIPANFTTWQLPAYLTGSYTIRLITGRWAYVGWIEL